MEFNVAILDYLPRISAIMKLKAINDAITNLILAFLLITSLITLWQLQVTDGESGVLSVGIDTLLPLLTAAGLYLYGITMKNIYDN